MPGALHPEGDRFIMAVSSDTEAPGDLESGPQQLVVVLNFFEELRERLGDD